ncbi:hypothetical protein C8A05DRAFT_32607 [Staphylotrichum tortipilum]|uniref:Rhodopsin domain-containing protein n=1 Tax=Staphylotrichum tortipilum TaxID=2831512 RepID=A0AAN6RVI9_9PEZI|nr:hypothetical protein C8A05DRAFT_32607 [Staphylotrichum longicolle]
MAEPNPRSPNPALDHESRADEIIAILSIASVLSTLVVAMRTYSRAVILRSFGPDDAIIIPAQILTLASALAIGLETKYGLGRHIWMMPAEDYIPYMKSFYASIAVYNVAVCLTKISILLQYRRIFSNTKLHKTIVVGLAFLICWGITLSFLLPLVCVPVAAFWDSTVDGFCLNSEAIWYVMAGVNVVTDFIVFSMPIPVISSLHLPTKQKILLLVVFTLGIFPCGVSIYRIRTLAAAADSTDPTWDNADAAAFSFLELSVGVIAVCLPTLRPILMKAMPRIFGSLLRSGHGHSGGGTGPSGGHASRTPFGRSTIRGGSSAARGSIFKGGLGSMLRESESTEGLRGRDDLLPRSRLEQDIEFGDLEGGVGGDRTGTRRYSVSVVAGQPTRSVIEMPLGEAVDKSGIKTTTVVMQKVTFTGEDASRTSGEKDEHGQQ